MFPVGFSLGGLWNATLNIKMIVNFSIVYNTNRTMPTKIEPMKQIRGLKESKPYEKNEEKELWFEIEPQAND